MRLNELSESQISQLKQAYLVEKRGSVSWSELANADSIVGMPELEEAYGNTSFVDEDFSVEDY